MTDWFCEIKIMTVEIIFGPKPPNSCLNIYDLAEKEGISTQEAAIKIAKQRINAIGNIKLSY